LDALQDNPEAVILLGDSAYNRSKVKKELGLGHPVPLEKSGNQPKVKFYRDSCYY
jgi:hypothetical protein